MRIEEMDLSRLNRLAEDYHHAFDKVSSFFESSPFATASYNDRIEDLQNRVFPRQDLIQALLSYNQSVGNHAEALENIKKLENEDSFVIIGGQQAGLATGPMMTIHKIITILTLARQESQRRNAPVVPVFWIAGEDHDFEEVNHLFVESDTQLEKLQLAYEPDRRQSVSHTEIPDGELQRVIEAFFEKQIETEFTAQWKASLLEAAEKAGTLVDFFADCVVRLFGSYGLVLVDSASEEMRALEKPVFRHWIRHNNEGLRSLKEQSERLQENGYPLQVELNESSAQFFIYHNGERRLVERQGDQFTLKHTDETYTVETLLDMLEKEPERFSANVVTRPLMQEWIFPTLAFVGGPGEIAYWAQYRRMFEVMGMKMPIVFPRMSITYVEGTIQKYLHKYGFSLNDVYTNFDRAKDEWLREQDELNLESMFEDVKEHMMSLYGPVIETMETLNPGMKDLGEKNLNKILEQVHFLEKRAVQAYEKQHASALRQMKRIKSAVYPDDKPQERVYTIYRFLNKYGPSLLDQLLEHDWNLNGNHKIVYL